MIEDVTTMYEQLSWEFMESLYLRTSGVMNIRLTSEICTVENEVLCKYSDSVSVWLSRNKVEHQSIIIGITWEKISLTVEGYNPTRYVMRRETT